jgi:hypothetical protein
MSGPAGRRKPALAEGAEPKHPVDANAPHSATWTVKDLAGILAGLAGVVGLIYLVGGLALYVELFQAGVPAGEAVEAFDARRFVLVGVPVFAASVFGLAVAWAVITALVLTYRRLFSKRGNPTTAQPGGWTAAHLRRHKVAALLGGGVILLLTAWGVAAVLWPSIELRRASVELTGERCIEGGYISADARGVHLADGKHDQLLTVANDRVVRVRVMDKSPLDEQSITPIRPCPRQPLPR